MPVAYCNTAYDQDLAQGSRTVFVQGQPVARRDINRDTPEAYRRNRRIELKITSR